MGSAVTATHDLPPICILAGGRGTRLGELVQDVPKPLLPVAGEPFLLHQLRLLRSHGARRVVLAVDYLGELIERRLGSEQFGMRIAYSYDGPHPAGTLGAIRRAVPLLGRRFLVLYGDTYLRLDYRAAVSAWETSGRAALMTVLLNEDRWDTSNAVFSKGNVTQYDKYHPTPAMRWIDYGLGGLTERALECSDHDTGDLAVLYRELAKRKELCGFEVDERFFEIGTPESLRETDGFLSSMENRQSMPGSRSAAAAASAALSPPGTGEGASEVSSD
jgi:N-acetyl-alpha-D-muramate 1-phosphate uridylyltransferase